MEERTRQALAAATRFSDIREWATTDSTNRVLLDLAAQGAPEGVVVVADYQTDGRGRLGRRWDAPAGGALLVSILIRPEVNRLPPDRWWLVGAAVALAAADACTTEGPEMPEIKWPNDLLLGGRKLAGILAQARPDAVVVGIGVNVAWAPPGAAALGPGVDRGRLLAALLENLEPWCDRWDDVGAAYRERCATPGREVRVETAKGTIVGRAEAVEDDGRLRVAAGDEVYRFGAGDVIHLRAKKVTDP